MKKLFIAEELRTLQQNLSNEKEAENLVKRVEGKRPEILGNLPNIVKLPKGSEKIVAEKNKEKIVAEKNKEKLVAEKAVEVKAEDLSALLRAINGIKDTTVKDRLL